MPAQSTQIKIMKLREQFEYSATIATLNLSRILPEGAVYALFKGFALLFHAVSARRRKLALRNTEIAFPEKPLKERQILVKKSYVNLSESMALNILIMTNRVSNDRLTSMVSTDDWERFDQIQQDGAKGLLAITGHVGNWELLPQYAALRLGRQVHAIARKGNNQLIEDRVVRPLRERIGVSVFYKKNALMRIMKAINKGEICGLLIDQKLNPPEGIYVDVFGKPAPTTGSSALLQIRFGVTVQPAFMVKDGHRKYRLIIGEPVRWEDNGKPMEEQVHELTRIHQQLVEDIVRQYPDQWFWAHNRWGLPKVK
jgi:KDO2-lipid IV(A) lauroyltransferase